MTSTPPSDTVSLASGSSRAWPEVLEQAIAHLKNAAEPAPQPEALAQALLAGEKLARRSGQRPSAGAIAGTWRLGFITGTKKSRQRAGVVLGAGRFLPRWLKIQIDYRFDEDSNSGTVLNRVRCGPLNLTVSGPIRFFPQRRVLAFDFPQMAIALAGLKLFDGYIPQGKARESAFLADGSPQSLRDQAFFTYFWVNADSIAARGRGGGLAIWYRED